MDSSQLDLSHQGKGTPTFTIRLVLGKLVSLLALVTVLSSVNFPTGLYYGALVLVVIGWLSLAKTLQFKSLDMLEKAMLFFWLFYCVFTLLDLNFRSGWNWVEFQEPSRFVLLTPVFLYVRRYGVSVNALRWGMLIGAVFAGVWGLYQKLYLGVNRAWGGASGMQIAAYGDISLIMGVMSVAFMQPLWQRNKLWLLVTLFALSMGLIGSLASGTKGGWVSMPFLCWVLVELNANPTYKKRFAVLLAFAAFAISIWLFVPFIQDRVSVIVPAIYEYFVNGRVYDGSAGIRLALWHGAALIFFDNPLLGTGPGTYAQQLAPYVDQGRLAAEVLRIGAPHSQFFNSIVESGIFGPLMVYGIYGSFILHCKRYLTTQKSLATAGILLAIGFMDFGLVEVIWDINVAGVFFTTVMMLIAGQLSYIANKVKESV